MELEFTQDQDELRDAIRAVLAKECPIGRVRAVVEGEAGTDDLWRTVADLGWPGLTVPEAAGGIGLGAVEAGILAEECGRALFPTPLLATATQFVPAVRECGTPEQQERFLGAVAAGNGRGTLALAEAGGSFDPAEVRATFAPDGDGFVLAGEKRFVMEADAVDDVVVVARAPGSRGRDGLGVFVVPVGGSVRTVTTLDLSRRLAHLDLDGVRVGADRRLPDATRLDRALEEATVGLALEMVGTAQAIFDVTLAYAKEREQFGVPIGSFQAVKHKLADMLVALERARATGYFAALTIAEDDPRRARAASVAKVAAGDCQRLLAKEGVQLHGGIGYTWEHDMQLYVRRAKSGEPLLGSSAWHRDRIARLLGV